MREPASGRVPKPAVAQEHSAAPTCPGAVTVSTVGMVYQYCATYHRLACQVYPKHYLCPGSGVFPPYLVTFSLQKPHVSTLGPAMPTGTYHAHQADRYTSLAPDRIHRSGTRVRCPL